MLTELRIHNFAIIDQLDLRFGPGLIILTGETGAGKSIILDAVVMLIGGKADTTFVRTDADAAFVEGVFHLRGPEKETVHAILQREELMDDPDYVVLMREIRKEGRSVARVNGRTVNVSLLKELGALLVDIHWQAEHLSLLDTMSDLIHSLRDYLEEIEFNPKRLDEVEERLDLIHSLTRKYGGSIPAVIASGAEARKRLETITTAGERIEELERQEAKLLEKLAK